MIKRILRLTTKVLPIFLLMNAGCVLSYAKSDSQSPLRTKFHEVVRPGYIWFDLGNVLVETRDGFDNLRWMPGVFEHLKELEAKGFRVGLITNIPEKWGQPGDKQSKLEKLQEVIQMGWKDSDPFDLFAFSHVLLPLYRSQSKPAAILYQQALAISRKEARSSIFQGESPAEVEAAIANGMRGHLVRYSEDGKTPLLMPIDRLPRD